MSGIIESKRVAGENPEKKSIHRGLRHEAVLCGQVDSEVHDGDRGHAQGTVGRGQGTADSMIGPQMRQVTRGREDHGAQAALQTLGAVLLLLTHVARLTRRRQRLSYVCLNDDFRLGK